MAFATKTRPELKVYRNWWVWDVLVYWFLAWLVWNPLDFRPVVHGPVLSWTQFLAIGFILATLEFCVTHFGSWHKNITIN